MLIEFSKSSHSFGLRFTNKCYFEQRKKRYKYQTVTLILTLRFCYNNTVVIMLSISMKRERLLLNEM